MVVYKLLRMAQRHSMNKSQRVLAFVKFDVLHGHLAIIR